MNPLKPIIDLIKFIYWDIKTDIHTIKEIYRRYNNNEPIFDKDKLNQLKRLNIVSILKDNWLFFLLLILAFLSGFFIASKYYQNLCNQFIFENYIKDKVIKFN